MSVLSLNEALKNYIFAQEENNKTKHQLAEAKTILEMECRKLGISSDIGIDKHDWNLKTIATMLSGKLQ